MVVVGLGREDNQKKSLKDNRESALGKGIPAAGFGMNKRPSVGRRVQGIPRECLAEYKPRLRLGQLW